MVSKAAMQLAYPAFRRNEGFYYSRIKNVLRGLEANFGQGEYRLFTAPGRTEIGGNHTDHQRGCVLAAAIDCDMIAAARKNGSNVIRIRSGRYPVFTVDLSNLGALEREKHTSAAMVRGMAAFFRNKGYDIAGFDAFIISDIPSGSGLSSSAAFEMLIGSILNGLFSGEKMSPKEMAIGGQLAENLYFGKNCGLMDQTACAVGGFCAMDFEKSGAPVIEKIEYDLSASNYALCIINSRASHAGLSKEYDTMPGEMGAVAAYFGKDYLREVDYPAFQAEFAAIRKQCGDRAALRAFHFFEENMRAQREAQLLKAGDFDGFLNEVNRSGQSSYMYLQNVILPGSVQHQPMAAALSACHMLLGEKGAFRVHGGGLGGAVQAFVPKDMLQEFALGIDRMVGQNCCRAVNIRSMGSGELR